MGDNKIFHSNTIMLLGKTFSFTPDEANVGDLAKDSTLLIIYSFNENPELCVIYTHVISQILGYCDSRYLPKTLHP